MQKWTFLATAVLALLGGASKAEAQSEYALKGAFLYNFAKYVEWPGSALNGSGQFVIGVLGSETCASQVQDAIGAKQIEGRRIAVKRISSLKSTGEIHLLFVQDTSMGQAAEIASLKNKPILIVGESAGFASKHGHIEFVPDRGRVAFEINDSAAKDAGISISSKLLQLARRVR